MFLFSYNPIILFYLLFKIFLHMKKNKINELKIKKENKINKRIIPLTIKVKDRMFK